MGEIIAVMQIYLYLVRASKRWSSSRGFAKGVSSFGDGVQDVCSNLFCFVGMAYFACYKISMKFFLGDRLSADVRYAGRRVMAELGTETARSWRVGAMPQSRGRRSRCEWWGRIISQLPKRRISSWAWETRQQSLYMHHARSLSQCPSRRQEHRIYALRWSSL